MELKKSDKANLEKKRFAFFQIGLIVSGAFCLVAFEYSSLHQENTTVQIEKDLEPIICEVLPDPDDIEKPKEQVQNVAVYMAPIDTVVISSHAPVDPGITTITYVDPTIGDPVGNPIGALLPEPIVNFPDVEPYFPGGEQARVIFIQKNVVYPVMAFDMGADGTAYVEFVVNTDGSICDVVVKSDIHKDLKSEAIRVVKLMPNWIPGEQAGKKVRVRFTMPINFIIK